MTKKRTQWGMLVLIILGVLPILGELALHFWAALTHQVYEINHWVIIIGSLMGFVGCFGFNAEKALEGGGFIARVALNGVSLIRTGHGLANDVVLVSEQTGRRDTDVKVVAVPVVESAKLPETPPAGGTP